ncbi:MAG: DciA family protein, partial [Paracoccus sp. (in: a-proteobacteria)]
MAQANDNSRKGSRRRRRGFEAASSLLAERVQKAAEGRGFAVSRLLTHWPEIAGDKLAGLTRPVRISHGRGSFGATLTLLT